MPPPTHDAHGWRIVGTDYMGRALIQIEPPRLADLTDVPDSVPSSPVPDETGKPVKGDPTEDKTGKPVKGDPTDKKSTGLPTAGPKLETWETLGEKESTETVEVARKEESKKGESESNMGSTEGFSENISDKVTPLAVNIRARGREDTPAPPGFTTAAYQPREDYLRDLLTQLVAGQRAVSDRLDRVEASPREYTLPREYTSPPPASHYQPDKLSCLTLYTHSTDPFTIQRHLTALRLHLDDSFMFWKPTAEHAKGQ
ncbi:hypothetical protein B9479_008011, partial [Cryptococcus floricola]